MNKEEALRNLPDVPMKWISVTDELPDPYELVEVTRAGGGTALVYRRGWAEPYMWTFKSGLNWHILVTTDFWEKVGNERENA